jgi:B-cell receptor-associated protein 31
MSLQWTFIAAFLYGEIAVVFLLITPFISAKMWNALFKSRFLKSIAAQSNIYFTVMIAVLVLFFLDSIREMMKYSNLREHEVEHAHLDAEMQHSMKMFRAQRNFYIAGFALFLWLVIRRLVTLISYQANLMASNEATLKQAQNASAAAAAAMEGRSDDGTNSTNEIQELKKKLDIKEKDLTRANKDRDTMKIQADNLAKQYDELCDEHARCTRPTAPSKDD